MDKKELAALKKIFLFQCSQRRLRPPSPAARAQAIQCTPMTVRALLSATANLKESRLRPAWLYEREWCQNNRSIKPTLKVSEIPPWASSPERPANVAFFFYQVLRQNPRQCITKAKAFRGCLKAQDIKRSAVFYNQAPNLP